MPRLRLLSWLCGSSVGDGEGCNSLLWVQHAAAFPLPDIGPGKRIMIASSPRTIELRAAGRTGAFRAEQSKHTACIVCKTMCQVQP